MNSYGDSLDPEKLVQCPYDKSHQIRACRFPYHLIKCRKNHPSIANQMATCPFNARHQVPQAEISHHISNCDDKSCIEQDVASQSWNYQGKAQPVSSWQCPPCNEDWDQDLWESNNFIFVWGGASTSTDSNLSSQVAQKSPLTGNMTYGTGRGGGGAGGASGGGASGGSGGTRGGGRGTRGGGRGAGSSASGASGGGSSSGMGGSSASGSDGNDGDPRSNLASGMRVPKSLPYALPWKTRGKTQ
ncbi:gametocyte-specific factor 1-like isoform X2 [Ornithorhynchus anatinus]|uniref:gametocyte-specific factor 1-like isoform X2 n=1 Tax=Ornithorhynchus anatinus TaxID=9258 RepID=UPI0004542635|nr:gametocyte-specific factor 1-like isoform X2 [Ornithorhynchus anatinus]